MVVLAIPLGALEIALDTSGHHEAAHHTIAYMYAPHLG